MNIETHIATPAGAELIARIDGQKLAFYYAEFSNQMIARYELGTIAGVIRERRGLMLDFSSPELTLSAANMAEIAAWLVVSK
jgi:hypothetical protein